MIIFALLNYIVLICFLSFFMGFPPSIYQESLNCLLPNFHTTRQENTSYTDPKGTPKNLQESKGTYSKALEGHVAPSPQGYVRLSTGYASQLVIDSPHPLPKTGQKVKKGQIIACLQGVIPRADEAIRRKELHDVEAEIKKLSAKAERLKKIGDFVPRVELENTLIELTKAQRQREVFLDLFSVHCIHAPLAGIIKVANLHPGQVLKAEDLLAEIFSPQDFHIMAKSNDYSLKSKITKAYATFPGRDEKSYSLIFEGVSPEIESDKSQTLIFSLTTPLEDLVVGMPANVYVYLREEASSRNATEK